MKLIKTTSFNNNNFLVKKGEKKRYKKTRDYQKEFNKNLHFGYDHK